MNFVLPALVIPLISIVFFFRSLGFMNCSYNALIRCWWPELFILLRTSRILIPSVFSLIKSLRISISYLLLRFASASLNRKFIALSNIVYFSNTRILALSFLLESRILMKSLRHRTSPPLNLSSISSTSCSKLSLSYSRVPRSGL
jgi:hypothetical protein